MSTKKTIIMKALAVFVLFAGLLVYNAQPVFAVSAYIDAQPEAVETGQTVEITVVFSGDNVGRVRATLEYDKSVLSYQGEEGDTGSVSLSMAGSGGDIVYTLPFKAVGEGSTSLTMTPLDVYDLDEMDISLPEAQSMTVTVREPSQAAAADTTKEDTQPQDNTSVTTDSTKNTNAQPADSAEKAKGEEKTQNESGATTTIWLLAGIAVALAIVLTVLVVRGKSKSGK